MKIVLVTWVEDLPLKVNGAPPLPISWKLGESFQAKATPQSARTVIEQALNDQSVDYLLFWDQAFGEPPERLVTELIQEPIDIWHAGLLAGLAGQPEDIDYVSPAWMLNRDPDPGIRAISWRISLSACLIRSEVLRCLGQIDPAFESLASAGLEMGYRFIWRGAVIVNEPRLLNSHTAASIPVLSVVDRYVFFIRHYHKIWQRYLLLRRSLANGSIFREIRAYLQAIERVRSAVHPFDNQAAYIRINTDQITQEKTRISVLIPTLCRYEYLKNTLEYLRCQTVKPWEVLCIDQTPLQKREPDLYQNYQELNLRLIWKDEPGQCSARNAGLQQAKGDLILFLDDDVIIPSDYIQSLLECIHIYSADIANGVWSQSQEQAVRPLDRRFRVSDRLATGNSLVRVKTLKKVGGFDLHYNRNYRADADYGMRLYLSGAISMITPRAKEHSLSPPTGGLKFFGTTGGLRDIGLLQPWPAVTQSYYWLRYLSQHQRREALILAFFASAIPQSKLLSASSPKKAFYILTKLITLPFRLYGASLSLKKAQQMLEAKPQITEIF